MCHSDLSKTTRSEHQIPIKCKLSKIYVYSYNCRKSLYSDISQHVLTTLIALALCECSDTLTQMSAIFCTMIYVFTPAHDCYIDL